MHFESQDRVLLFVALAFGVFSIVIGGILSRNVMNRAAGDAKMKAVGDAIKAGALAYLIRQVKTMVIFVIALAIGLFALFKGVDGVTVALEISGTFIFGVLCSYLAGFSGMLMAVNGNVRVAEAAKSSNKRALETAFLSGSVTGVMTVGLGLTGASLIFLFGGTEAMKLLVGFGFGSSLAALFMRVGGGIFTKAADVGADLVGKVEAGIPEDDPRNPAVIADNVGDNVGDCAGMAADVFESYSVTLVASIVLGAATAEIFDERTWMRLVLFAIMICGIGIFASIIGIFSVKGNEDVNSDPLAAIRGGFKVATIVAVIGITVFAYFYMGGKSNPIQSNTLVPFAQLQQNEFNKVLDLRKAIAAEKKEPVYQVSAAEIQADPRYKGLGFSADEAPVVASNAINFDPSTASAIPKFTQYRPINFNNADDPALKGAVIAPPSTSGGQPEVQSVAQMYAEGTQGNLTQKSMGFYELKITPAPTPSSAAQGPKTIITGPWLDTTIKQQIDQANQGGQVKIDVQTVYPAYLYENPDTGKILVAADMDPAKVSTETINRTPVRFYTTDPSEVSKFILSQGQSPEPPHLDADLAFISHRVTPWYLFILPVFFGILLAFGIERLTDYYVSTQRRPTQEVAGVSSAGAAPMFIQGFSYALESSVFMVVSIVVALLFPLFIFPPTNFGDSYVLSFYGVAIVGLGLLTTTGFVLAMDTFGPISDNAQGVFEMSGAHKVSESGAKVVARLDAAGNTTKALTKGFAITTAVIAAVALFHSYLQDAHLANIGLRLDYPEIFLGLLIGGAAPFLFSAFSINAVGRAAFNLINEVRRQFHEDPGIMKGTSTPNYANCVSIVTAAAQRELLGPGILAIGLPLLVGFGFSIGKPAVAIGDHFYNLAGAEALGGFLAGAILSGQLMAVLLANSGGMWDNAKKIIEDGLYGGKGSESHKAAVVCDTVGDPFKDTAGPALNPLIKVMNLVSLLIAPTIILPLGDKTLSMIAGICFIAIVISIILSKKGSLSDDLQSAADENHSREFEVAETASPKAKRKITVDDSDEEEATRA